MSPAEGTRFAHGESSILTKPQHEQLVAGTGARESGKFSMGMVANSSAWISSKPTRLSSSRVGFDGHNGLVSPQYGDNVKEHLITEGSVFSRVVETGKSLLLLLIF